MAASLLSADVSGAASKSGFFLSSGAPAVSKVSASVSAGAGRESGGAEYAPAPQPITPVQIRQKRVRKSRFADIGCFMMVFTLLRFLKRGCLDSPFF
jgi:hypothetical protein